MTKEEYTSKIIPLISFERETVPVLVLEQIIPLELLFEKFPDAMLSFLRKEMKDAPYTKQDFSLSQHVFSFADDVPYYVFACHFPFTEDDIHIGLISCMYIILSEELQGIHCFFEILQQPATDEINSVYELRYLAREEEGIQTYPVSSQSFYIEDVTAIECAKIAKRIETEGVITEN